MSVSNPDAAEMLLINCRAIPSDDFPEECVARVRATGGQFVQVGRLEPAPVPLRRQQSGSLVGDVRHPFLGPDSYTPTEATILGPEAVRLPLAHFAAFPDEGKAIMLSQPTRFESPPEVDDDDPEVDENERRLRYNDPNVDAVAHGLLRVALELYPLFRPHLGLVDESAFGYPPIEKLTSGIPPVLFWANFFSPDIVRELGRDFLLAAPGWRLTNLDDGGVLYVATQSYTEWWREGSSQSRDYFRLKLPEIEIFRGTPIRDW